MHAGMIRHILIYLFFIASMTAVHAGGTVTLELRNMNLADAVRLTARFLGINVVISPTVKGAASLNLHNAAPEDALNMLLTAHGLAKWKNGSVTLIAPRAELIKRKQEEVKWRELLDDSAPLIIRTWQIRYAKAKDIADLLQDEHSSLISKRGRVRVDYRTNRICVQDARYRLYDIRRLIDKLDMPVEQVSIEARLVSVDNDFERELGIQFAINTEKIDKNEMSPSVHDMGRYSLAIAKLADRSLLDVKLSALEKAGHAQLISSPSLFTSNQQQASIEAGEEVPYQEVSESGGTAVAFKKAVLGLKVTPQVLPDGYVLLQLQINQDRPISKMVLGMPAISTRQMVTSVLARSGQTIVLGGIYETNREAGHQGLPFLSRLPGLGILFKQQTTQENKRELFIFVTPTIIT